MFLRYHFRYGASVESLIDYANERNLEIKFILYDTRLEMPVMIWEYKEEGVNNG